MVSQPKWRQSERNLEVGDIGHIKYDQKIGSPTWKLAWIKEATPDSDGKVRTITVSFCPKHQKDKGKTYTS